MNSTNDLYDLHQLEISEAEAAPIKETVGTVETWIFMRRRYSPVMSKKLCELNSEIYYRAPDGQHFKTYRTYYGARDCVLLTKEECERAERRANAVRRSDK
jgi:hypothetical protein